MGGVLRLMARPLRYDSPRAYLAVLVMRKAWRLFKIGTGYLAHSLREVLHWLPDEE